MMWVVALLMTLKVAMGDYPEPPPIFQASPNTVWDDKETAGSRRAQIHIPFTNTLTGEADTVDLIRLDLVGDAQERGFAHGALLHREILEFMEVKLPIYYEQLFPGNFIEGLPPAIQKLAELGLGMKSKHFFESAMWWVYQNEEKYMEPELITEMEAIADGVCSAVGHGCNVTMIAKEIKTVNMFPELVRMACTAYGAWGSATEKCEANPGGLVQVRALDFGGGPFANYTVVSTSRPKDGSQAFVSVGFPGLVGAITGISEKGVGISEKVFMVSRSHKDMQYGRYDGVPDVFALRHILEHSASRVEAESYLQSIMRTFAIFIGIGDYETQKFDLVTYKRQAATVYTDETITDVTSQPSIEDVCYVDRHPQPSTDTSLPQVLSDLHGDLSAANARVATQFHKTGDLHIAVYDYSAKQLLVSVGRVNGHGDYCPDSMVTDGQCSDDKIWMAYNRPYVQFDLATLFEGGL